MKQAKIDLLVLEAQEGKKRALALLYGHFVTPMRRFALMRVKDIMVAEDLVQNVWLKVARRIQRLENVSLFRSWLYRALRWEITDYMRANSKWQQDDSAQDELAETPDMVNLLALAPMIASLPEDEKDVVELFYLNDLSLLEVALVLEVPEGTVKSRLHRARTKLRKLD
ncbi:RNA polymerase sigma factor [Glaciecola sp. 1036]|uniref:RNA polymerase sigma factor n=1 Tax=Alteromonadaceae TaxID=72275 RepID=UPI003D0951D9